MADEKNVEGNSPPGKKSNRKSRRIIIPILLLILAVALVAIYWYLFLRGYVSTDDAYIDSDAITVSAKMMGRLETLNAGEGDSITVGQLLAQLDDSDLKAQEAQAKAGLEYVLRSVPLAKIGLDLAKDDFDRASFQYKNKVIPQEEYDHARKALEMARAQHELALSHVNASRAQLDVIETQLENTRVFARKSAIVAKKWVVPGDVVQPGQPILTLYDLEDLWITANIEETKLGAVHLGDSVRVKVDADKKREFTGTVELVGAAAASQFALIPPNNASGNFTKVTQRIPIRISIGDVPPDSTGARFRLIPGMSVEVKIRIRGK
jgi:membrane fusion protein (multidrug efflux system)